MSLVALLPLAWVRKPHLLAEPLAEIAALDEKQRSMASKAQSGEVLDVASLALSYCRRPGTNRLEPH
jgi:hypothetical protein